MKLLMPKIVQALTFSVWALLSSSAACSDIAIWRASDGTIILTDEKSDACMNNDMLARTNNAVGMYSGDLCYQHVGYDSIMKKEVYLLYRSGEPFSRETSSFVPAEMFIPISPVVSESPPPAINSKEATPPFDLEREVAASKATREDKNRFSNGVAKGAGFLVLLAAIGLVSALLKKK